MRKIISFMHVSLDGLVAGPRGEMNWIKVGDDVFEYASKAIQSADMALYGRTTYEMMESYWPKAGEAPDASWHDKEHSSWYNKTPKIVLSRSWAGRTIPNATIVSDNVAPQIRAFKEKPGKDIVIFGSPGAAKSLLREDLVDELWLFVNPILLGKGMPMFGELDQSRKLKICADKRLLSGVVVLKYEIEH